MSVSSSSSVFLLFKLLQRLLKAGVLWHHRALVLTFRSDCTLSSEETEEMWYVS